VKGGDSILIRIRVFSPPGKKLHAGNQLRNEEGEKGKKSKSNVLQGGADGKILAGIRCIPGKKPDIVPYPKVTGEGDETTRPTWGEKRGPGRGNRTCLPSPGKRKEGGDR